MFPGILAERRLSGRRFTAPSGAPAARDGLKLLDSSRIGRHLSRGVLSRIGRHLFGFNRTREYEARNRGESFHERQFASPETVTLEPLPAWAHLPPEKVTELIREMVERIEVQAAQRREETRAVPLGPAAIKAQRPHHRPSKLKKSPAPLFHAATRRIRRELYDAYKFFLAAFRDASERLRSGDRNARFPSGCFPPALPFVSG
jgi:hypothetical protein